MARSPLAIAAGMLLDLEDPVRTVEVAAEAGFDGVGVRVIGAHPDAATLTRIRRTLERTGLTLLDLELIALDGDGLLEAADERTLSAAVELQPRHLTVVSYADDRGRTAAGLDHICEIVGDAGVVPALEFLPFSGVRTFAEARSIVEEVGRERAAVLVDVLHIVRSGDEPEVLEGSDATTIPYVQLCDAPAQPADPSDRGLYREAVAERVLPGDGDLPLARFLRALPPVTPLSVEVLSKPLMRSMEPLERAVAARETTEALLATL